MCDLGQKIKIGEKWYLQSEMISGDLVHYDLLQLMDKDRFPPLDLNKVGPPS